MVSVRLVTPTHKRVARAKLKLIEYSDLRARRLGEALLRLIGNDDGFQHRFHYFTRETLLQHFSETSLFGRVSTIYRYNMLCAGVTYLLSIGALEKPKSGAHYLCLPRRANMAQRLLNPKIPLNKRYFGVIKDTVMYCFLNETASVDTLLVTQVWQRRGTAPETLSMDELRVLVRRTLHELVKQDLLIEQPDYSYTLKA